jgi:hypothetical protein
MMFRIVLLAMIGALNSSAACEFTWRLAGRMDTNGMSVPVYVTWCPDDKITGTLAIVNEAKTVEIEKARSDSDGLAFEIHDNAGRIVKFRIFADGTEFFGESTVGGQVSKIVFSNISGSGAAVRGRRR